MIFGKPDPSADWPEQTPTEIEFSLINFCVNGVCLGDRPDNLSEFGRPSNKKPFKKESFTFAEIGLHVESKNEEINYIALLVTPDEELNSKPCNLSLIMPDGERRRITDSTNYLDFHNSLGEPKEVDKDEEENIYFFSIRGKTVEFECTTEDFVKRINCFPE